MLKVLIYLYIKKNGINFAKQLRNKVLTIKNKTLWQQTLKNI